MRDCFISRRSRKLDARIAEAENDKVLRGFEGIAARDYFSMFPFLIRRSVPDEMTFVRRSRRPPEDRINALLGFGYSLVYQSILQGIVATGLEPSLGFFHRPRSSAHPLVLDLMELFRLPLWDMPMLGSINRLQWDVNMDFEISGKRVWLSESGRKKAVRLFEERLSEQWHHPVVDYSLSYGRLIELEVRLLEKEWSGNPGLFAKFRLR